MHTHNHIGELAEQRGCQVPGAKEEVSRLGALLKGTSPATSSLFWSDRDVNRQPFGSKTKSLQTKPLPHQARTSTLDVICIFDRLFTENYADTQYSINRTECPIWM